MGYRAKASGIVLTADDAAIAKGMLIRGDRQHDIAAWFGVNPGRIAEIATGFRFTPVEPIQAEELPRPGPYPAGKAAVAAISALAAAKSALANAESMMRRIG